MPSPGLLRKSRPWLDGVLRLAASLIKVRNAQIEIIWNNKVHKKRKSQNLQYQILGFLLFLDIRNQLESASQHYIVWICLACFPSLGAVKSQPPWPGDQFHPHGEQATLLPGAKQRINRVVQLQIHPSTPSRWRTAKHGVLPEEGSNLGCSKYWGPSQVINRRIWWSHGNLKKFP